MVPDSGRIDQHALQMPDVWLYTDVMGDKISEDGASRRESAGQVSLDDTDRQIVRELLADGRLSVRALAEAVHISRAGAYARLRRLEEAEVITGYTAKVRPERVGLGTSAYVSISVEQNAWKPVAEALTQLPSVETLALVGADFDALAHVRARDNHELRDVVLEQIQSIPGIKGTRTWLIFDELPGVGVDLD